MLQHMHWDISPDNLLRRPSADGESGLLPQNTEHSYLLRNVKKEKFTTFGDILKHTERAGENFDLCHVTKSGRQERDASASTSTLR